MAAAGRRRRVVIMGAGGRDFHNFNMLFRTDPGTEVVAFTAAQIPFQGGRRYPTALAGPLYPKGIQIVGEEELPALVRRRRVDEVILAYSDLSHRQVMAAASRVLALGADFRLIGPQRTMLKARLPVISVCAVRTGCGKSPVTRYLCRLLLDRGRRPAVIRHPMAYGRLSVREVEEFRIPADLDRFQCTLEEREEYEPLIALGVPVFAGVDYRLVLTRAQQVGDVLLWDGGNNDFPFLRPDLEIVLVDPLRAGDEVDYYPGLVNLLRADVVVVAKADAAPPAALETVRRNVSAHNPKACLARGALEVTAGAPEAIRGQRVAVVEDGPTLTHGGMSFGAGMVAARRFGAREIVDPRPHAAGSLAGVFSDFPHIGRAVPAMGYSAGQLADLQATLEAIPCDLIVSATPVDLGRVLRLSRPMVRVTYEFRELDDQPLAQTVLGFLGPRRQEGE